MEPPSTTGELPQGILARAPHLGLWVHVAFLAATVASAVRYVSGHGLGDRAPLVLAGGAALVVLHLADPRRGGRAPDRGVVTAWFLALLVVWLVLVIVAPSFAWVAVPLAFVALQVLPFPAAATTIAAMAVTVAVTWSVMQHRFDPTVVVGPAAVATLTVLAYRALAREADTRRRLLDELRAAHAELSEAQHTAGAMAERARLSREIHDSVAQGLSSINLLLQAADQHWGTRPEVARVQVEQAARTARDGLDEVRRLVRDLAPDGQAPAPDAAALAAALRRACLDALAGVDLRLDLHVHGEPRPVPADIATAVLRSARGALANVVEHAAASTVTVSLTYQPDAVILDVCDDGRGFEPGEVSINGVRGRGLAGMAARARQHGGELAVESAPGGGTALAVSLPAQGGA